MSIPVPSPLSFDAKTKILLLRTLYFFSAETDFPTATELAKAIDVRTSIPRGTISSRRAMIRSMREAGLVEAIGIPDSEHERLVITDSGVKLIHYIDSEGRK